MTNREYYKEKILDIACNGGSISIDKMTGELFECTEELKCEDCLFHISECEDQIKKWANTEHIEQPKLTKNEKLFLSLLKEKWKYMTKDKYGCLWVHNFKPLKLDDVWKYDLLGGVRVSDLVTEDMFSMIKWEDENPWSIEDLKKLPVEEEN